MRTLLAALTFIALLGCNQEDLLQKFASQEEQAEAKSHIDRLRAGKFDEIEKVLDPSIRTPNIRDTLAKMSALIPNREPTSVKLVGFQTFQSSDTKTVNITFEYNFDDKWLLANVALQEQQGKKSVIGFNINPITDSLQNQNKFTLTGKGPIQYAILVAAITSILITLYSIIVCARTKFPKRKWLWILFILVGFGKVTVNWTTGEWAFAPISIQLFSASATAMLYGPWTIGASLPLGAILFLFYKRPRLTRKVEG